ncbi:PAS domain S-box protein, partial [bacterium]|nr:PAS domain S-box protein [bacterium]
MRLSIQNKIILIFILTAIIFTVLFRLLHENETKKMQVLLEKSKEEKVELYDKIFALQGEKLKIITNTEYSLWDEMANFILSDTVNKKFATVNIDFLIQNYDFNLILVCKPDFSLFYSVTSQGNENLKTEFLSKEILENSFKKNKTTHFFTKTSYGLLEIRGAGIQFAEDDKRLKPPLGYFFTAKILDKNYFNQIDSLTICKTELISDTTRSKIHEMVCETSIVFVKPIQDWKNEALVLLKITNELEITNALVNFSTKNLNLYILSALISIILASLLMVFMIFKPLRAIFKVLETGEVNLANQLSEKDNEFGRLNSLIKKFFAQREELLQEISLRKQTERDLKLYSLRLKGIIESTQDIVFALDKDYKYLAFNENHKKAMKQIYGLEIEQGKNILDFMRVNDDVKAKKDIDRCLKGEQFVIEQIYGDEKFERTYFEASYNPIKDENAEVIGTALFVKNISERKQAEQKIFEEKERLSVTLRSIGDGVITTDTEGKVVLINQVGEKMTGWLCEEAAGKPLAEVFKIINESSKKTIINPVEEVLKTEKIVELANHTILVAKDGTEKIIADSAAPIKNKNGQVIGVVLVFRDVTEKKRMEDEILRGKKLESLGILAGGIAHDFNNMLTGILGNISILKLMIPYEEKINQRLDEAEKATERAKSLTQQLLTFSKGGSPVKEIGSLANLVREVVDFTLSGSNIIPNFIIDNDLWLAKFDAGQINQVLSNLVINAIQAMPNGGKIEITCKNIGIEKTNLSLKSGNYILISVKDYGIGIPPESKAKVFDPYFTTKQKGHGLGLATSYSIINKHDGLITLESELGVGTTFFIYIPASESQKIIENENVTPTLHENNSGKILVLDDDEQVLDVVQQMLTLSGYEV